MYMPDIGRWGAVDPMTEKYEIVTPYNYAFSNPVVFVDPDGRKNVIYLIAAGGFSQKELKNIESMINSMFQTLKLETQAVVFNEKERGKFSEEELDDNDNWAVIGSNRNAIVKKAKSISSDRDFDDDLDNWSDDTNDPETSNRKKTEHSKGVVVDYSTNLSEANGGKWADRNPSEEAALATIHGAGHSSHWLQTTKNSFGEYGHTDNGVMQRGPDLGDDYRRPGYGLNGILTRGQGYGENFYGNEVYRLGMMERYGTAKAKVNYPKKKK
jgi:hypothetical protein